MSQPYLKVTSDFTKQFNATIKRFKQDAVLVGVPQEDAERDEDDPINNATILAINHFGSEDGKIPPRPVLYIGLRSAQQAIADQFKKCAKQALSKGPAALELYYERAGTIASNAIKRTITNQDGIKPPAEATLKARKYLTKSGFKGTKSLLVTGQLRNAITYVVRSIWGS